MTIYEALGIAYVVFGTAIFTVQVIYFGARGVRYTYRLVQRAETEENIDIKRSLSIRRELANIDK